MESPRRSGQTVSNKASKLYSAEMKQRRQKRLTSTEGSRASFSLPKINQNLTKEEILNRLSSLVGLVCDTNAEKYHILRRRDEFISKLSYFNCEPEGCKFIKGSCQDMCPEKERYMRDVKKNLHFYECDAIGRMDHGKMVKDYSRSAADQDMPLAHELRPLKVLQTTMDYLIFNIASEIPSSKTDLARWYDFLWSRTRAIRKDITQQMLQNESAVDLVEKCARFHIFAAFKLGLLDAELFDHKINTENLSKSMQTLRHMYDDLAKENLSCGNEPEFRSYDIILNLSDFNVHSQVLSYRQSVRESKEVQFALNLASALQNNNYILFFRLVRNSASFLQACLCHQFFALIRSSGLKVICMAYSSYPLEKFVENLAFDSLEQALSFMKAFGVERDMDSSLINTRDGKNVFTTQGGELPSPSSSIPQMGCAWIEAKSASLTIPQIFYNCSTTVQPAANFEETTKIVCNSFSTESNAYENDPVLEDLFRVHQMPAIQNKLLLKKKLPSDFSFAMGIQQLKPKQSEQKNILSSTSSSLLVATFSERFLGKIVSTQLEKIVKLTLCRSKIEKIRERSLLFNVLQHWISFTRRRLNARLVEFLTKKITEEFLDQIVIFQLELKSRAIFRQILSSEIARANGAEIIEKVVSSQLFKIATTVKENQKRDFEERLNKIRENLHRKWLRQFTDHWLAKVRRNRLLRSITFISPTNLSNSPSLLASSSNKLFHPELQKFTSDWLREKTAQKRKQMEQQQKEAAAEKQRLTLNGSSNGVVVVAQQKRKGERETAASIRDAVLDGVSFRREDTEGVFFAESGSVLRLFNPGIKRQSGAEHFREAVEQRNNNSSRMSGSPKGTDQVGAFHHQSFNNSEKRRRLI